MRATFKKFFPFRDLSYLVSLSLLVKAAVFHYSIGSLGVSHLLKNLGIILLAVSLSFFLKKRKAKSTVLILINLFISLLLFADTVYFRYYGTVLSYNIMLQYKNISGVERSVGKIIKPYDLIYFIDFLLLLINRLRRKKYLLAGKPTEHELKPFPAWKRFAVTACLGCLLFFSSSLGSIYAAQEPLRDIFKMDYERLVHVKKWGIAFYHAHDFANAIARRSLDALSPEELELIETWFGKKTAAPAPTNQMTGIAAGKNLIIIQVEALQHFVLNTEYQGQEITPHLNSLARKYLYFNNIYYQTADGNTSDAEFITNTSLFPLKDGSVNHLYPNNNYNSLAKILKDKGYSTAYFHANRPNFWNRDIMMPSLGFDDFFSEDSFELNEVIGMGLSDGEFLRQSLELIKDRRKPYYVFLSTLSSHHPYNFDIDSNLELGALENTLIGDYMKAINYTDRMLGEFIENLRASGMLENSLVVIYGDHGAIPEENRSELGAFLEKEDTNEAWWIKQQKIPLIMMMPSLTTGETIDTLGGQIDIMPTLLNLLGVETGESYLMGSDLFSRDNKPGLVVFPKGPFLTGTLYFDGESIFNVQTEAKLPLLFTILKDEVNKKLDINELIIQGDYYECEEAAN